MPQSWGVPGMEGQEGEVEVGFEKAFWDVSPSASVRAVRGDLEQGANTLVTHLTAPSAWRPQLRGRESRMHMDKSPESLFYNH